MPSDEFFNTGIVTYLWILNKNKPAEPKRQGNPYQRSRSLAAVEEKQGFETQGDEPRASCSHCPSAG